MLTQVPAELNNRIAPDAVADPVRTQRIADRSPLVRYGFRQAEYGENAGKCRHL
jgi:hypothetical protein